MPWLLHDALTQKTKTVANKTSHSSLSRLEPKWLLKEPGVLLKDPGVLLKDKGIAGPGDLKGSLGSGSAGDDTTTGPNMRKWMYGAGHGDQKVSPGVGFGRKVPENRAEHLRQKKGPRVLLKDPGVL